jgi:hypothetical protein
MAYPRHLGEGPWHCVGWGVTTLLTILDVTQRSRLAVIQGILKIETKRLKFLKLKLPGQRTGIQKPQWRGRESTTIYNLGSFSVL